MGAIERNLHCGPKPIAKCSQPKPFVERIRRLEIRRAISATREFEEGLRILRATFPPGALVMRERMIHFLRDPDFHFDAACEGEKVVGVNIWRNVPPVGTHHSMLAADPELRERIGLGTMLDRLVLEEMVKSGCGPETTVFCEVEIPRRNDQNQMRGIIRPKFHNEISGFRAAEGIDYYAPNLHLADAPPTKLLLCFRKICGALPAIPLAQVAGAARSLYFVYYCKMCGAPLAKAMELMEQTTLSILGQAQKTEIRLREISELAIG